MNRPFRVSALAMLLAGTLAAVCPAQSLSTTTSNNGTGGVFMHLTPTGAPLHLTGFTTQLGGTAGVITQIEVWTRPGTYAGFTGSNSGWTLSQTVSVASAGGTVYTAPVVLPVQIPLPAGTATSVYLHSITANSGVRFTGVNATPPQTTWSNTDLTLVSDFARTGIVAFAGNTSSPRCFPGTVFYVNADASQTGACCSTAGGCTVSAPDTCAGGGGLYQGPGTLCEPSPCPVVGSCCAPDGTCTSTLQAACLGTSRWNAAAACGAPCPVGACCLADGSCVLNYQTACTGLSGFHSGENTTCPGTPCYPDIEPNNLRVEAPTSVTMTAGAMIRGRTMGTQTTAGSLLDTTADYYRLKTPAAAPGLYRYRMLLTSSVSCVSASISGLTQSAVPAGPWPCSTGTPTAIEGVAQASIVVDGAAVNTWYGFGEQEEVYYRITGGAGTPFPYQSVFEATPVTATDLGTFFSGAITITTTGQGHNNDTAMRVFDSSFDPVPGFSNDDASLNGGAPGNVLTTSFLRRTFAPGVYYLGLTIGELTTDQGAACDDNTRNGVMLDFPNAATGGTAANANDVSFSIDDGTVHAFPAARGGRGDIAWFRFTVMEAVSTGACCNPSGVCAVQTLAECQTIGDATFAGTGTTCVSNPCQMGGCCLFDGSCMLAFAGPCAGMGGLHLGEGVACPAPPCYIELEPNAIKEEATALTLASGQTVRGRSNGSNLAPQNPGLDSFDVFLIQTPAAAAGIYQHRMTLECPTPGHTTSLRGVTQAPTLPGEWPCFVGSPTLTEVTSQILVTSGDSRIQTWYGFGRQERVYFRVGSGLTSTVGIYEATLQSTPITPTDLGTFNSGQVIITTGGQSHNNDTALRVFDGAFMPIEGYANDDASTYGGSPADSGTVSFLRRTYTPGVYYLAVTVGDLSTNQGAPCDDNNREGNLTDFGDVIINGGTSTATDVSFVVIDDEAHPFTAARGGAREVAWFSFTIADQSTGVCCRGATCSTAVSQAECTTVGRAGAVYATAAASCNAGGNAASPCCYADYNKVNGITVQDIFDFLADYFGGSPNARVGGDGTGAAPTVQSIFDFLAAYFAGAC